MKNEMMDMCRQLNLPITGSKFELRDRIMYAFDNDGALLVQEKPNKKSKFNWAREPLTLNTEITDNITFGQNLRAFFTEQIGQRFKFTIELWSGVKPMQGILSYSGDQMVRTRSSSIICRISD